MSKYIVIFLLYAILLPHTLTAKDRPAQVWHFPGEAMDDLTRLTREALFAKWNPVQLHESSPEAPGEYVQYQHETLTYYFGPFFEAESTERAQTKLLGIQQQLLERDPKFATSRVSLHQSGSISSPENLTRPEPPERHPSEVPHPITSESLSEEDDVSNTGDGANPILFWISSVLILIGTGVLMNIRRPSLDKK